MWKFYAHALLLWEFGLALGYVPQEFPSPLEELARLESSCGHKWRNVFEIVADHDACLAKGGVRATFQGEEEEERDKFPCDNLPLRNRCWEPVTNRIDDCVPNRGRTVLLIYSTFLNVSCKDEDQLRQLRSAGKLCTVQATLSKSCSDEVSLTSPDLCKSFTAQKLCEEGDFKSCKFPEHKALLEKHLGQIQGQLGCGRSRTERNSGLKPIQANTIIFIPVTTIGLVVLKIFQNGN